MTAPAPFKFANGLAEMFFDLGPNGTAMIWYAPQILCCQVHPAGQFDAAEIAEMFVKAAKGEK